MHSVTETKPFNLPLTPQAFKRALEIGHGRAWLHASTSGIAEFESEVLHALLQSLAFDTQCEGDRGQWMMAIIDASGQGHRVYDWFLRHVHQEPEDDHRYWHLSQRATVLGELGKRSVPGARLALDQLFFDDLGRFPRRYLGACEIIESGGEQGLVQVCSAIGNSPDPDDVDSFAFEVLSAFDDPREEGAALKVLQAARSSDAGVDRFLAIRDAREAERQSQALLERERAEQGAVLASAPGPSRGHRSPEEVIELVRSTPQRPGDRADGFPWLRGWGRKASDQELGVIFDAIEATDVPIELRRYLRVFSGRAMPRVSDWVVELAEHGEPEVRASAYAALANVSDPRIREVALRSLSQDRVLNGALRLMQSSYQPGDHVAIEAALFVPPSVDDVHSIVFDLAAMCERVCLPECFGLLLFIYGHSPCGNCRCVAVETMLKLNLLPAWIAEEAKYDAMDTIREQFGGPALEH